jgi:UDP-N-acetylmuramoyl-L-alanyl-D-glutamate--2,6-diaminopimelate ligase
MGAAAGRWADVVVLTSDNPRGEDPLAIIDQIRSGIGDPGGRLDVIVEPDRGSAIREALAMARPGDVVVVAGKGHETTQTIGDQVLPFDDRVEAELALGELAGGDR